MVLDDFFMLPMISIDFFMLFIKPGSGRPKDRYRDAARELPSGESPPRGSPYRGNSYKGTPMRHGICREGFMSVPLRQRSSAACRDVGAEMAKGKGTAGGTRGRST